VSTTSNRFPGMSLRSLNAPSRQRRSLAPVTKKFDPLSATIAEALKTYGAIVRAGALIPAIGYSSSRRNRIPIGGR
jgi:hypothetical protein